MLQRRQRDRVDAVGDGRERAWTLALRRLVRRDQQHEIALGSPLVPRRPVDAPPPDARDEVRRPRVGPVHRFGQAQSVDLARRRQRREALDDGGIDEREQVGRRRQELAHVFGRRRELRAPHRFADEQRQVERRQPAHLRAVRRRDVDEELRQRHRGLARHVDAQHILGRLPQEVAMPRQRQRRIAAGGERDRRARGQRRCIRGRGHALVAFDAPPPAAVRMARARGARGRDAVERRARRRCAQEHERVRLPQEVDDHVQGVPLRPMQKTGGVPFHMMLSA
ncbi:MAG TPA: hypothetical protein VLU41_17400 [Ideonella sp.]|nr:hypothetical protein [Ideonella sp.]